MSQACALWWEGGSSLTRVQNCCPLLFWNKGDCARALLKEGYGCHGCPPSLRKRSNRRDYSSVVECSFLLLQGRQPPSVEYIAPAAAVSRGAGSSTDHGLIQDLLLLWPCSLTIRNDMIVDERSLAHAHGGVFVVNARLLVPDLLIGRVLSETLDGLLTMRTRWANFPLRPSCCCSIVEGTCAASSAWLATVLPLRAGSEAFAVAFRGAH